MDKTENQIHGDRPLYLFRLSNIDSVDWDTYDAFIVAGYCEEDVRVLQPTFEHDDIAEAYVGEIPDYCRDRPWASAWPYDPERVKVECIGVAAPGIKPGQVLCSSFNAG